MRTPSKDVKVGGGRLITQLGIAEAVGDLVEPAPVPEQHCHESVWQHHHKYLKLDVAVKCPNSEQVQLVSCQNQKN